MIVRVTQKLCSDKTFSHSLSPKSVTRVMEIVLVVAQNFIFLVPFAPLFNDGNSYSVLIFFFMNKLRLTTRFIDRWSNSFLHG